MFWIFIIIGIIISVIVGITLKNCFTNDFYRHLFGLEEVFNGELDFIHLSKNILLKVLERTSSTAGIIYWYDEVRNEFKLKALSGIPIDKVNQITRELRKPQGILEKIQLNSAGVIINNLKSDAKGYSYLLNPKLQPEIVNHVEISSQSIAEDYISLMATPLIIYKNVVGILVLLKVKGYFSRKQFALINTFAQRAAVQLESARLYQLAKETSLENAKLYVNISKLYQKATLDELTGLYNRHFLMQRIKEEIKKSWRFRQTLSLIFMDLDFFKNVNDQYGHQIGDQLLMELGEFIKKSIRDYDVACRFGGEEFVILLPQTKLDNAYDLADRLRENIANQDFCSSAGMKLKVTASFGVSMIPDLNNAQNPFNEEQIDIIVEQMIAWADDALYQAKKAGRNRVISHMDKLS